MAESLVGEDIVLRKSVTRDSGVTWPKGTRLRVGGDSPAGLSLVDPTTGRLAVRGVPRDVVAVAPSIR